MLHDYLHELKFLRQTEEAPDSLKKYSRLGKFSWYNKPEGEGLAEKFFSTQYVAFWGTAPSILFYCLCYKKYRHPMPVLMNFAKFAWPFHAAAATFSLTATGLCAYRGVDDGYNWGAAGALTGAFPAIAVRRPLMRSWNGRWQFGMWIGMAYIGMLTYWLKINDPRFLTHMWESFDEKHAWNPESNSHVYQTYTMPGERFSFDFYGGQGSDMPFSWIGEKMEHRQLMTKQKFGYLESELDKVPEYENIIRNRI